MKDDHDSDLRRLVAGARREFSPMPADAQRVLATVRSTLGAVHTHSDTPASQPTAGTGLAAKLSVAAIGLSVIAVSIVQLVRQPAATPSRPVATQNLPESAPLIVAAPSQPISPQPAPAEPPRAQAVNRAASGRERKPGLDRNHSSRVPPVASMQVELDALRRVELALREGHAERAMATLAELDRSVPDGKLHEERGAARAIARCALEPAARKAVFRGYAQRHPTSMYLRRVESSCQGE